MAYLQETNKPVTLTELARMHAQSEKIAMLTCYDASFASLLDRCGVDVLLVGDSLGNVLQGHKSTLPVTLEHMIYHTECVARGSARAMVITDMPFGSYQESSSQAMRNAVQLMAAGAQMVKLEGGDYMAETVQFLVERGVPVCAHIGFTPQSVHQLGGYRVQGKSDAQAAKMKQDALALQDAGATLMVLEMVPAQLATEITQSLEQTATIGIGAGAECAGQVLVLHDILGVFSKPARFVRNFMDGADSIEAAIRIYVDAVKQSVFPAEEHSFLVG